MRKIDKSLPVILSVKYNAWLHKLEVSGKQHPPTSRYYYDDVAMNLYRCQFGVCAYTEMFICIPELFNDSNWIEGRYKIPDEEEYKRTDHLGELDHFDPSLKANKYWLWSNLFMIHAKINSVKTDSPVVAYLKPDLEDYAPEKYFDYDESTHRYVPNVSIEDQKTRNEIQYMIDKVLFLNHGVVRNERRDFISTIKFRKANGEAFVIDRFFTAAGWCVNE